MAYFPFLRRVIVSLVTALALAQSGLAQRTEEFQVSSPGTDEHVLLGWATAIDGDWAVVADYYANTPAGLATGACLVYRRSEQGWAQWQVIWPSAGVSVGDFGVSVALHGEELVIGSRRGGTDHAGQVFVYRLVNDKWELVQQLRAFDGGLGYLFGKSVAFDAQTLVVGSPGYPDSTYVTGGRGTAYIYTRSGTQWVLSERIPLPDHNATPHSKWGVLAYSCAVEDDVLVLGAHSPGIHGMAFAYRRMASGWVRETDLYLPQYSSSVALEVGYDVDISDGVIAVGAPVTGDPWAWAPSQVAFFEFESSTQEWELQQTVRASDASLAPGGIDKFGYSLSMSGDRLIVGAKYGSYDAPYSGTAYVFERLNGLWVEIERLVPTDPNLVTLHPSLFGASVALDGRNGRALIGAINAPVPNYPGEPGKAYFYDFNLGTVVCPGLPNVTLKPARLTITGSRRVPDANLSISVYDAPRGFMGMLLVGPGGPPVPFGANSSLCVGQPFSRLTGVKAIGPHGSVMHNIDFAQGPAAALISPGVPLTFQYVHRDKAPVIGISTITTSDAVEVIFE